ncbi:MAG: methyltransferase domain-containing protein [Methanolinea sp.]|nr:methyltransferase domain-containing protein [Methanolinea sp.]
MDILVELAGDHPDLPYAELDLLGPVKERSDRVAVVDCRFPEDIPRLALAHAAMEYLGSCPAKKGEIARFLDGLALSAGDTFAARVHRIPGSAVDADTPELERLVGSKVRGRVDLSRPAEEFRAVISGSRCYLGRVVWKADPARFSGRRPGDRPFFHPGVMMPRFARALVNIACARKDEWVLDPFCGTGGIVLEAIAVGARAVGSDRDPLMARGSRKNLPGEDIVLADATSLPFPDASFDAVVTDLPYGQSVSIHARSIGDLVAGALREIGRVLKPGRRAVIVYNRPFTMSPADNLKITSVFPQRVHRSLTRYIHVCEGK